MWYWNSPNIPPSQDKIWKAEGEYGIQKWHQTRGWEWQFYGETLQFVKIRLHSLSGLVRAVRHSRYLTEDPGWPVIHSIIEIYGSEE